MTRQQARSHYLQAERKLAQGKKPSGQQEAAFNLLAGSFVWETAFNDVELIEDFAKVLLNTGALDEADRESFFARRPFVALHALTVMHMSHLLLPDGSRAPLRLMIREATGTLRIAANIRVADVGKPVTCSLSIFETSLDAKTYSKVRPQIGDFESEVPIEIGPNGILEEIV